MQYIMSNRQSVAVLVFLRTSVRRTSCSEAVAVATHHGQEAQTAEAFRCAHNAAPLSSFNFVNESLRLLKKSSANFMSALRNVVIFPVSNRLRRQIRVSHALLSPTASSLLLELSLCELSLCKRGKLQRQKTLSADIVASSFLYE